MAQVVFIIPDPIVPRVLDGIAYANGYQDEIDGQPNPEPKAVFARRAIRKYMKDCVVRYESGLAAQDAGEAARQAAESEIDINE